MEDKDGGRVAEEHGEGVHGHRRGGNGPAHRGDKVGHALRGGVRPAAASWGRSQGRGLQADVDSVFFLPPG